MISEPIETVGRVLILLLPPYLGAFTFITVTILLLTLYHLHSTSRMLHQGMSVGAVDSIHYILDALASFIGPLFGILLIDVYWIKSEK